MTAHADARASRRGRYLVTLALAALATVGFAFTVYLTAIELFVLHAMCRWCVASALIMTATWVLSLAELRRVPSTTP